MPAFIATIVIGSIHGALIAAVRRAARRLAACPPAPIPPAAWPPVRILLPFAGTAAELGPALDDLAAQEYPDFDLCLAYHATDEAAGNLAHAWKRERAARPGPAIRVASAETARFCGQKNQNLLAALAVPDAADRVLVFTDADYRRTPDWLRQLVEPIADGRAAVASGYYFAEAGDGWRSALRPVTALLLFLTRQSAALRQPWGGATAIPRRLFDELGIAELWSTNVVDDVALAERLRQAGVAVEGVNAPALRAPARPADFSWGDWFARQLAYLRAIQPATWAGLGVGLWILTASCLWMVGMILRAALQPPSLDALGPAGLALLDGGLWVALGLRLHALHPGPGSRRNWLAAFFAFFWMAPVCHLHTALSRTIRWRGVEYRVGRGGRVLATSASPERPPAAMPATARPPPESA
ncbi:MAG: glycosyltransferase family 2 protein [Kiritimatiellia bacterium]